MDFDPIDAAAQIATAAEFERLALDSLGRAVGYDVAFMGLYGGSMTSVGLTPESVERAVRPGSPYAIELAPVKRAALAARGVAVDTEVLGESRVLDALESRRRCQVGLALHRPLPRRRRARASKGTCALHRVRRRCRTQAIFGVLPRHRDRRGRTRTPRD